jgi:hypothetical protein
MSFSVRAYIVDWNELQERWKRGKKPAPHTSHWFYQAVEDKERWVKQHQPKPWIDSANAMTDAAMFYDDARSDLKPAVRKQIDKYLRPFIALNEKDRRHLRELAGSNTEDGLFEMTMSPETVEEILANADFRWLDALRPLWEEHSMVEDPDFTHIKDFRCFTRYMNQWKKLLETAATKKRGVVISIV